MSTEETEVIGTSITETSTSTGETALQPTSSTNRGLTPSNGYEEEVATWFIQDLDEAWLTDSTIAEWLSYIAQKATKTMSIGMGETLDVPDYKTRLSAFKLAMEWKWLLKEKAKVQRFDKSKIYVLD